MAGGATFRVNTREFTATLRRYREFSRRDPETICNTKAFYIARRATVLTPKASGARIRKFVRAERGAILGKIINRRRGASELKGLWGKAMAEAVALVLAARLRSAAFLKSGWLPAIRRLEPYAERTGGRPPRMERATHQYGAPKGEAKPARPGWMARAIIANMAQARWDKGGALKLLTKSLQAAFDFEARSMKEYIERKLRQTARRAGIKTN